MKQKVICHTEQHRNRAIEIIRNMPLEPVHEVIIREYKKDRSADQNALYWKWLTIIGAELGEPKEAMHERYKAAFLVNIYTRDNTEYASMIQSLRNVYKSGLQAEAMALHKKVVELTSTTSATVAQMSEYLDSIKRAATELNITLPGEDYVL